MFFSIKYRYRLHLSHLFCCYHTCFCLNMVSVTSSSRYITSASRYHPRYQSRSSMYIRGRIPRNFAELAEVVPIGRMVVDEVRGTFFYVRRVVDLMKTAKVNAFIMYIFGKIELLSIHAAINYFKMHYFNDFQ